MRGTKDKRKDEKLVVPQGRRVRTGRNQVGSNAAPPASSANVRGPCPGAYPAIKCFISGATIEAASQTAAVLLQNDVRRRLKKQVKAL